MIENKLKTVKIPKLSQKKLFKKQKALILSQRMAFRAQAIHIGRTGGHINRTEKLIALLSRDGKRKRIEDAIFDLKIRIKEYFLPRSSADFLENLLTRLEPMLDIREVKGFKRKHTNVRYKQVKSFLVSPASTTRRIRLGLGFFVKAVHLTQKKLQFTLTTAMMAEVVALCHGLKCHSMRLKRDHIGRTIQYFNRFGTPVTVGSKVATRRSTHTATTATKRLAELKRKKSTRFDRRTPRKPFSKNFPKRGSLKKSKKIVKRV